MSSNESCKQKKRPRIDRIAQMRREKQMKDQTLLCLVGSEIEKIVLLKLSGIYVNAHTYSFLLVGQKFLIPLLSARLDVIPLVMVC